VTVHVGIDATTWWNERGFGRFTREIVRALARRDAGFHYTLFIDHEPDETLPSGVEVEVVPTRVAVTQAAVGDRSRSLLDLASMSRAVSRSSPQLMFFPAVYSYVPLSPRIRSVVAFHDTIAERYPQLMFPSVRNRWLWKMKVRIALAQATRLLTVSEASARDMRELLGVPRSRIDIVSEAADPTFRPIDDPERLAEARARYEIPASGRLLVYVGGLNPHKNLMTLLEALIPVAETDPDVHLAIIGDISGTGFHDNAAELMAFVRDHQALESRVHFTGYVSEDDLVSLYNAALALVLPSLWEGFGLPAVEAMACGLPVLASRRGSLEEVVGDAGVLFDPESAKEIRLAIERVLGDEALCASLRARSIERAARFTWERGAELTEASFRRCLSGSR
jgi:alpha-1,3-rhamnosyl/mannosyltransferase